MRKVTKQRLYYHCGWLQPNPRSHPTSSPPHQHQLEIYLMIVSPALPPYTVYLYIDHEKIPYQSQAATPQSLCSSLDLHVQILLANHRRQPGIHLQRLRHNTMTNNVPHKPQILVGPILTPR